MSSPRATKAELIAALDQRDTAPAREKARRKRLDSRIAELEATIAAQRRELTSPTGHGHDCEVAGEPASFSIVSIPRDMIHTTYGDAWPFTGPREYFHHEKTARGPVR